MIRISLKGVPKCTIDSNSIESKSNRINTVIEFLQLSKLGILE